jgi:hypothetical protein
VKPQVFGGCLETIEIFLAAVIQNWILTKVTQPAGQCQEVAYKVSNFLDSINLYLSQIPLVCAGMLDFKTRWTQSQLNTHMAVKVVLKTTNTGTAKGASFRHDSNQIVIV